MNRLTAYGLCMNYTNFTHLYNFTNDYFVQLAV